MSSTEALTQACLDKVRSDRNVTFVELEAVLRAGGADPSGTFVLEAAPNLILWAGMSAQFGEVIEALRADTEMSPASVLVYMHDGGSLGLPIAKNPPKGGYRKPHWVPAVLNVKAAHDTAGPSALR